MVAPGHPALSTDVRRVPAAGHHIGLFLSAVMAAVDPDSLPGENPTPIEAKEWVASCDAKLDSTDSGALIRGEPPSLLI